MALQIRRGTDTQRQALSGPNTPIAGELLYSTDNKKLHIGDGTTTGGTSIGYFGSVAVSGKAPLDQQAPMRLLPLSLVQTFH